MGLLAEIASNVKVPGGRCTVARIVAVLPSEDVADLHEALTARTADGEYVFTAVAIARALEGRGHRIAGEVIGRHRRGECACPSLTS